MIYPHFERERYHWDLGQKFVVGVDEAGRGPLAGPVAAGAVIVFPEKLEKVIKLPDFKLIRDSKTLSAGQREKAYEFIVQNFEWGVGLSDEKTIDRVNILQASYLAMKKALSDLKSKTKHQQETILVDGRHPIPNISTRQESIIGGDKHIFSISAASIIAKVTRDRLMLEFHKKFPQYGFLHHKGYGTRLHFRMIEEYGPCEIHRKSFKFPGNPNAKAQISNQAQNQKFKKNFDI
ncbi:MAG TPA: ribonuclease HII [Candidatus Bathyarchaeia archaeon]|nr:ribonuclease HII [Candidatus Bathyarchaeia archaeon]